MDVMIQNQTIEDEHGKARQFSYHLLIDPIESGNFICENYGVCVREEQGESVRIPGITTSALRIDHLLRLLIKHKVGPTTLRDVVSDWL